MPGVLFLVENPTKDWFYDQMEPWVHYIPINANLLDIRSAFEWAERNQERVKIIAQESTKLAKWINSEAYMQAIYKDYFLDDLIDIVKAYDPEDKAWEESLVEYSKNGIHLEEVSECSIDSCAIEWKPGVSVSLSKVKN
jgi:Glycosyl transferase family 90